MQPLLDCPACAQLVLADAPHCPFCGARMAQGSILHLGLGLTIALGVTTAACAARKSDSTTQNSTDGTDTDGGTTDDGTVTSTTETTVATTTGNDTTGPDGTTTTVTTTGPTSTTSTTVSSDSWDSDAAAASYAGPDEQDSTDKV